MRLERISWVKAAEYFEHHDMVMLPLGSIESHGRHLPLGTDFLIPGRLVELIEQQSEVLVAPAMPYGNCDYLADFPGTVSLGHEVLYSVLTQITQHLRQHGARRFVILNGHGGNVSAIDRVALDLRRQGCLLARLDWWLMAGQLNELWKGGHGGAEETAGVMAVDPQLVVREEIADIRYTPLCDALPATGINLSAFEGLNIPIVRRSIEVSDNGWAGPDHPKLATRQMGEEMLSTTADYIVRFLSAFQQADLKCYDGGASVDITWLGHACFKLTAEGYQLVIDPYTGVQGYSEFTTPANAVVCSHGHGDHSHVQAVQLHDTQRPSPFKLTELPTFHDAEGGTLRGKNLIHLIEYRDLHIAHCGDLGHMPDQATLAALKGCDALMIPVGGHYTIDAATAKAVVDAVGPRVVIPMHYRKGALGLPVLAELDCFLALSGAATHHDSNTLRLSRATPAQVAALTYIKP